MLLPDRFRAGDCGATKNAGVTQMQLYLSKSRYCSAVQCPKMLWLKQNKPEEFDDSVLNQTILDQGNAVGDLAMGLFGAFREVPFGEPAEMLAATRALLDAGEPVIAEASFAWDGKFCSVDILKNLGGGACEIYEVKSATHVKDINLHDAAYQRCVLVHLGYDVRRVCIVHINGEYVRHGALEPDKLFTIEDVTGQTAEMQRGVEERLAFLEQYMASEDEPPCDLGEQCFAPYDCGFFGYCAAALPKPNVFDLAGMPLRSKLTCYEQGIVSFEALERCGRLKPTQALQVDHALHAQPAQIVPAELHRFLDQLSYPLYFLDFESFQPAVPPYDDTHPYQQIAFQYSLHIVPRAGAPAEHREFLAMPGADPRRALAERLCADIPAGVCTVAYNMAFEKGRIKEMAALFPDLAAHLTDIHDHVVDLMVPFRKKAYYTRDMCGSYSIKYVLPALFPDDPALDYHNLDGVHNGAEASEAFTSMEGLDPAALEARREQLLRYCELDTLAMVRIWEKLLEITAGTPRQA